MKAHPRFLLALSMMFIPAFAAVDGTVVNGTTGQPQANVAVKLVQPSQSGMNTLADAKTDAAGKFHFDQGAASGPQLVQAIFSGVTYTKMIPPGTPAGSIQVDVYNVSAKAGVVQVAQDLILFQPTDGQIAVNQSFFLQNSSKTTFNDPNKGSLHFYLPPATNGGVNVSVTAPGGMPVTRSAEKTGQKNVYSVDYPIRPGETRFDLTYSLAASNPMVVTGKILHAEGATRLAVPAGVTLVSPDITPLGQEPRTKASIYDVKGKEFKVEIQGTGTMVAPDANADDESGAPTIEEIQPRVYDKLPWILGIALGILGLGLFLLYRADKPAPAEVTEGASSAARERKARKGAVSR